MSFWGNLLGGVGGLVGGFMGRHDAGRARDAYDRGADRARGDVNNYYNQATGFLSPYSQGGQYGMQHYENMLSKYDDPMGYYNSIMSQYSMTPGAKFRLNTGLDAVRNQQASQGLGGSGPEQKALEEYTQGLINQDQQQYLNNVLGIGRTGLEGYGDLMHTGANAAAQMGDFAMRAGDSMGNIDEGQARSDSDYYAHRNDGFYGGAGSFLGGLFGGGNNNQNNQNNSRRGWF